MISENVLQIYEIDEEGRDVKSISLTVANNFMVEKFLVIKLNEIQYRVQADELEKAVANARNANK